MLPRLSFLLFVLLPFFGKTQKLLKGIITDEKNVPIPKASVFLNNTSIGTMADDNGNFSLMIPQGKYELIVSSVGFTTTNQPVNSIETANFITVKLAMKAPELESVIIEPYLKDGWEKWGRFFSENFLGYSNLALDCKLLNHEVLRFRSSKKTGLLTVTALEPLIIENNALGYRIKYTLESFNYDSRARYVLFTGYPFFEKMEAKESKQKKWEKERNKVYDGSLMHFMRSVFRNRIKDEGFEVRRLRRIPDTEQQRVKAIYGNRPIRSESGVDSQKLDVRGAGDSTDYYRSVLSKPEYGEQIGADVLPGDSIAYAIDSVTAGLEFPDYLLVIYKRGVLRPEYKRQFPRNSSAMMSQLHLLKKNPVHIQANGMYYNPADVLTLGYWAWWEKIAAMLPSDFEPVEN